MNAFPLIRTKWTNEHIMAALFVVLTLYNFPVWIKNPSGIIVYISVITLSLVLDAAINIIRYKKPVCAVSAAVTGAMLVTLAPGSKFIETFAGLLAALVLGKHIWGGTGKNIINPAITGFLLMVLMFNAPFPAFETTWLLLPALLLSLPFILSRPLASMGFMVGMTVQLLLLKDFTPSSFISSGVIFWGCLVVTDPVTITLKPMTGGVSGLLAGLISLLGGASPLMIALAVLSLNMVSYIADRMIYSPVTPIKKLFHIRSPLSTENARFVDLTRITDEEPAPISEVYEGDILERIKLAGVFGMGGAGFSAIRKIETLIEASVSQKHLIINGVECDPGLSHDKWLMRNRTSEISAGIELLRKCVNFASVTLAVKNPEGLKFDDPAKIHAVPDYYPVGAEKLLIREVLGMSLSEGEIPAKRGILILNVQTVYSIYEAVLKRMKTDSRFLTVADLRTGESVVAKVGLDMKIRDIIDKIFPNTMYAFSGGGIMQARQAGDDDIVGRDINFIAAGRFPKYKESPQCSKCGQCVIHCPIGLQVNKIYECTDKNDLSLAREYHPEMCISCGSCSYVCLAGRNLSARVRIAREFIISKR